MEPHRIGVFGGTYDPPHVAHLIVAREVAYRLGLDRLLLIPAAVSPHKRDRDVSPGELRLEMLRAATGDDPVLEASDIELRREPPSYTVDTLRELHQAHPDAELFLILGADQIEVFDKWRGPDEIRALATVVGFAREGAAADGAERVVQVPRIDISATEIRRRVAAGEPVRGWVEDGVLDVIQRERLYRD